MPERNPGPNVGGNVFAANVKGELNREDFAKYKKAEQKRFRRRLALGALYLACR